MKYRLTVEEVCKLLKEHFEANTCSLENKYDTDTYFELDVKTRAIPSVNSPHNKETPAIEQSVETPRVEDTIQSKHKAEIDKDYAKEDRGVI